MLRGLQCIGQIRSSWPTLSTIHRARAPHRATDCRWALKRLISSASGYASVPAVCANRLAYRRGSAITRDAAVYGSTTTLMIRCTSSSCCGVQEVRRASIRFRMSRGSSSRSRSSRRFGWIPNPFAIATIVSRLGTFFPRSTSPQKLPVMLPRSAASSRLSLAAFLSFLIRCANRTRCFALATSTTIAGDEAI